MLEMPELIYGTKHIWLFHKERPIFEALDIIADIHVLQGFTFVFYMN